jgi:hypothetical protein
MCWMFSRPGIAALSLLPDQRPDVPEFYVSVFGTGGLSWTVTVSSKVACGGF